MGSNFLFETRDQPQHRRAAGGHCHSDQAEAGREGGGEEEPGGQGEICFRKFIATR